MRISVLSHCRMSLNPCLNPEVRVLLEHKFKLEVPSPPPPPPKKNGPRWFAYMTLPHSPELPFDINETVLLSTQNTF